MKPIVRILIVTDDGLANGGFLRWVDQPMAAAVGSNSREFHLGEFIRVLEETVWMGFNIEITKAHRTVAAEASLSDADLKTDRGADVVGFRFNTPFTLRGETRTLSNYDMILFFPIRDGNPDPAFAAEAEAIASFMENGGGFFATGDHANLGSPLAGLIPRVRSMRRWYFNGSLSSESPPGPAGEPPAPPPLGYYRHDTTRPGADSVGQFEDQSDEIPQEITPALYSAGLGARSGYPARRYFPHPLLCSPDGVVRYLPDHMHEGTCEVPENLASRTFHLGSTTLREYPDYHPAMPPAGYTPGPLSPEVVAWGRVLPGIRTPALDPDAHTGSPDVAQSIDFGVIAAWDGHLVDKGRVVVDSTWHHFFNINLTGDRYLEDESLPTIHQQKLHGFFVSDGSGGWVANDEYKMIMWYFRNIVYWLIPANRKSLIAWETLTEIVRHPQLREELATLDGIKAYKKFSFEHFLYFGQLAERYLSRARGACAVYRIQRVLYKPIIPWWEWIQEIVDIWDPIQREKERTNAIFQHTLLEAMGIAPHPDTSLRIGLGAAIVAAAIRRQMAPLREQEKKSSIHKTLNEQNTLLNDVLTHALTHFLKCVQQGSKLQKKLEEQLTNIIEQTSEVTVS